MTAAANQPYGAALIARAIEQSKTDAQTYGDPSSLINRKRVLIEAVLVASGLVAAPGRTDGPDKTGAAKVAKVTPQIVTAIEAAGAIAGILNHPIPAEALSRFVATGMASAPMFEMWQDAALKAGSQVPAAAPTAAAPPAGQPTADADPEREIEAAFGTARAPNEAEG